MIILRDDDVLVKSSQWADPFGRFRQQHEWTLVADNVLHVPTILVNDLKKFPECIEYMQKEIEKGNMKPQLHGLEHWDYSQKTPKQAAHKHLRHPTKEKWTDKEIRSAKEWIKEHLQEAIKEFEKMFGYRPTRWMTPWGANLPHMKEVSNSLGITLTGVSEVAHLDEAVRKLSEGVITFENLEHRDVFFHWWSGGLRVLRFCTAAQEGSWAEAVKKNPELFK